MWGPLAAAPRRDAAAGAMHSEDASASRAARRHRLVDEPDAEHAGNGPGCLNLLAALPLMALARWQCCPMSDDLR